MGWQPIETAPKDGTPILAYAADFQSPPYWVTWWIEPYLNEIGRDRGGWFDWTPTHWMPLSPPDDHIGSGEKG